MKKRFRIRWWDTIAMFGTGLAFAWLCILFAARLAQ